VRADRSSASVKLSHLTVKPCLFAAGAEGPSPGGPRTNGPCLYQAQCGQEPVSAKALKGFRGRGVLEVVEDFDGNIYRAVYTVRFAGLILRAPCLSEEIQEGHRDAAADH
jgi:hypothetical protein